MKAIGGVALASSLIAGSAQAQIKIGDNPVTINPGSVLELESTNRGLLVTRIPLADRNTWGLNGNQPVEGMVVYNTTATSGANGLQEGLAVWKGGQWISVDETPYFHVNATGAGNSTLANSGATGQDSLAAGVNSTASALNATAVGQGSTASGTNSTALGSGATASHAGSVALGSGSTTAAAIATTGSTINGVRYNYAGTAPTSTVSVGDVGAERTVTNVAAGQVSATSTDAINGSQLHATNTAVEAIGTQVTNVDNRVTAVNNRVTAVNNRVTAVDNRVTVLDQQNVKYDVNSDGSVDYSNITLQGEEGTQIHNLANGTAPTDAVNVRQLNAAVTKMEDKSYAAASMAIALAAPPVMVPGKLVMNLGAGSIGGQFAMGLSARKTSEDGRRSIYGGIARGSAGVKPAISAGLSFIFD